MKRINNEQILDRIYDLADGMEMRIDDFISKVESDYGEQLPDLNGLPEDVTAELLNAREMKKQQRIDKRKADYEADTQAEIKRFRTLFPEIDAESIPDTVWDDVSKGESLCGAYAIYLVTSENLNKQAEETNLRNERMGAKAVSDGATEPVFTKELVEKMNGKDVKHNYKGILRAMKNWKFN